MPLIPIFLGAEVNTDAANRLSAFNFCDPFDFIMPLADGGITNLDRQHLWGMYAGIAVEEAIGRPHRIGWGAGYSRQT
jgi:hypothetical protein